MNTGKNCFTQFSTRMAVALLLTFFRCLHNQLSSSMHSINENFPGLIFEIQIHIQAQIRLKS